MTEFNLSDKAMWTGQTYYFLDSDVREFIKLLKEDIKHQLKFNSNTSAEFLGKIIDERAGDKLI